MKIAIIGYGSLIWDLECLAPHINGEWKIAAGPALPVEFSRISPKRKLALVLVVDEMLSHSCPTNIIISNRSSLGEAIKDLAARERSTIDMIAAIERAHPARTNVERTVSRWLNTTDYDAAIWTALQGNFENETGEPFSHEAGLRYLQSLSGQALNEAWRYITYAPTVTDTPFRRFLAKSAFWQALDEREQTHAP